MRPRTAATSLRSRLATALALVLVLPVLAAVIAVGVLAPRVARDSAERAAGRDADSVMLALAGRCEAIGAATTATAGELQAYAIESGSLSVPAAQAAARRAVSRTPGVAVAVFDPDAKLLAAAGPSAGLGPASAGGYGASCSGNRAGRGPAVAGLSRWLPVNTVTARVGSVVFWAPLDDAALRALRQGLHSDARFSLLAAGDGHRVLASTGPGRAGPAGGPRTDQAGRFGYALRPARPGVPYQVLVASPVPGAGALRWLGLVVLGLAAVALLPIRLVAGRLAGPPTAQLRSVAGELRVSRDALADTFDRFGEALENTHNLEKLLDAVAAACLPSTGAVAGVALLIDEPEPVPQARGRACRDSATARQAVAELPGFADRYFRDLDDLDLALDAAAVATAAVATAAGNAGTGPTAAAPLFSQLAGAGPVVAVPIRAGERVIGVLALARGEGAGAFDALALPRVRALADHAGTAIENVRLHEEARRLSVTDPLTGLANVRQLSSTLAREVERASRFDRPLTVLMLDLDNFKRVNDTLGHPFGDLVLREFAHRLQSCVREVDTVARYGGEEFAVVLLETDVEGGSRVAERILNAVRCKPFQHDELQHSVTVSIGVAAFPRHGRSVSDVLHAADEALYSAKAAGRDRAEVAGISSAPSTVSQAG